MQRTKMLFMQPDNVISFLDNLAKDLDGELFTDKTHRVIFATDASVYRELPLAVAYPKNANDIKKIIHSAKKNKFAIIPRAAGTSLAGQVVGNGLVVDVSRHLTQIIEMNEEQHWVKVQPGVVLDELNKYLESYGLFFCPETSTSNRCAIGGMVGNNACGSHSLIYGSTRDHLLSVKAILSDGSEVLFKPLSAAEFDLKCQGERLENKIYRQINDILSKSENVAHIKEEYPDPAIWRRNTGYAIDQLIECVPFNKVGAPFNFCKLIAGSEGTLAFITEIKLNLVDLPPKEKAVMAVHFQTLEDALQANLVALKYNPGAVELMDHSILNLTKGNLEQQKNRSFVKGDPGSILIIEFARPTRDEIFALTKSIETEMQSLHLGYHFPLIWGSDINKVWNLRKAGLGVLSNMVGDAKPVSFIEDTAVKPADLPNYIKEFKLILSKYNLDCVYHAHIGSGELHIRPILDLKKQDDVELFRIIAKETALLVKKYRGSFSGEHGDGRVRGEFIPIIIGERNYNLLKEIKKTWDPENILNPGKITNTESMNSHLRYEPNVSTKKIETYLDFSDTQGIVRAAEKCNGSGDCRKSSIIGGVMCPSFQASRDERNVTRARANMLREFITQSDKKNPFDYKELYDIFDLCLSCKACKSECPSSVDVAKLKAEFLQHYYNAHGVPLRTRLIANFSALNKLAAKSPSIFNFLMENKITSSIFKKMFGFASKRNLPLLYNITLERWTEKYLHQLNSFTIRKRRPKNIDEFTNDHHNLVYLFNDEFTNFNDTEIGIKTIRLLTSLGYEVFIPKHFESGRTFLSKGMIIKAKKIALKNVKIFNEIISSETPLIGIEPSAILTFRDEYPDLVGDAHRKMAQNLAKNCFTIEEFLASEMDKGHISKSQFTLQKATVYLHGHCQQKAISSIAFSKQILSFPKYYEVIEIPSGCCGMAGSFGYEKEHYKLSMQIGEMVLFPYINNLPDDVLVAASGTSCRCQIKDGTGKIAKHPVEILYDALA